jgi:hypothetical protein
MLLAVTVAWNADGCGVPAALEVFLIVASYEPLEIRLSETK